MSSEVSFGLSAILFAAGGYCVAKAARCDKRLLPLAAAPLVFGVQQFCEGWVWVGIDRSEPHLLGVSGLVFLFFALCFWPIWSSLSMLRMEPRRKVRALLGATALLGMVMGACLYLPLLANPDRMNINAVADSIYYNIDQSPVERILPGLAWHLVYMVIVAVPLLVSPVRRIFNFGMAVVLSAAVSHVFFNYTAASMWCLFAAVLSLYLSGLFYRMPACGLVKESKA